MGELLEVGQKLEVCAIIEVKARECFKEDWLKLCNSQEQTLSTEFKQQEVVLITF